MSLAEELLEHARFLANLDARNTTQANLRRAVSAAYYSVFHLLSAEVAAQVSPGSPAGLRERTQRALDHKQMLMVANSFSQAGARPSNLPGDILLPDSVSSGLARIAKSFKELQEARHVADYDAIKRLDPTDVLTLVQKAEGVFSDWKVEKTSNNAPVFLASLMFWKLWNK
jgi:uncharacterized protein (UPF0332 family)